MPPFTCPFDFVVQMLMPETFSQAIVRENFSLTKALSTLLTLVFMASLLNFPLPGWFIDGVPA